MKVAQRIKPASDKFNLRQSKIPPPLKYNKPDLYIDTC